MWKDYMSDSHVAAPSEAHVHPSGNVSPEPTGPQGIPRWLIEKFKVESLKRAEVRESALRAAFRMGSKETARAADKLLRASGSRLKWARGGSQMLSPRDPSDE